MSGMISAYAVSLAAALGALSAPSNAQAERVHEFSTTAISAEICSEHPELFKLRRLRAGEAMRFIRPTGKNFTVMGFESGYVVAGECTRFIKRFGNGVVLTNNAAFAIQDLALIPAPPADPSDWPPPSDFIPPKNVRSIASDRLAPGSGRSFARTQGDIVLWSGKKESAVGIVPCAENNSAPCRLSHLILSSPYRIRDFAWVPPLHESHYGGLWLQIALPRGEEASVRYSVWLWRSL